jgi:hypothetical protein
MSGTVWLDYSREPVVTPLFPIVFSQSLSSAVMQLKLVCHVHTNLPPLKLLSFHATFQEGSAAILLPLLLEEQIHMQLPNLIYHPRELEPHVTCGNTMHAIIQQALAHQIICRHMLYVSVRELLDLLVVWSRNLLRM